MIKLKELSKYNTSPCLDIYKIENTNTGYRAVFLKNSTWRTNSNNKITITFGSNGCQNCSYNAAWSNIGSQSTTQSPSMNLGYIDPPFSDFTVDGITFKYYDFKNAYRNYCNSNNTSCVQGWKPGRTVLHEFGHAMGMMHEHQNNVAGDNPFRFDNQKVIQYYQSLGYNIDDATSLANTNVINRYECTSTNCPFAGSAFDKQSIMIYPINNNWLIPGTLDNWTNVPSFDYSDTDKEWLAKMYPKNSTSIPTVRIEFLDGYDWQKYWVKKVVTEGLAPYVGINFEFPQLVNGSSLPINSSSTSSGQSNNPGLIIGIVCGVFVFVILLLYFFLKR
jgi:hypothetical protein